MRVRLRPAKPEDWPRLFTQSLPCRIKAITAELDGRVLGIGGIGYRPEGAVIAFAAISDEAKQYPAAIHRAGLRAMAMIRASGAREVIAEAQPDNPAAERWLVRLGFRPAERGGQTLFVWERPNDRYRSSR